MGRSGAPFKMLGDRFELMEKVGEGSFGMVFKGKNKKTLEEVAIKLEDRHTDAAGQLRNEVGLIERLCGDSGAQGIVHVHYHGKEGRYVGMVMDLLGYTLEDCAALCGGKLNDRSVILIAEQTTLLLEYVHSKGIVHRDIKTENFAFGRGPKAHHLYIIDFGMSTRYLNRDHRHRALRQHNEMTGTARYASINAMHCLTQSRRDDLEAVGHIFAYLVRGVLPWSGLNAHSYEEKLTLIREKKQSFPIKTLFEGHPVEFEDYLAYCRSMRFEQRPKYKVLVQSFRDLRNKMDPPLPDHGFQWLEGNKCDNLEPLRFSADVVQPDEANQVTE